MNVLRKLIIFWIITIIGHVPSFGYDDLSKRKIASQSTTRNSEIASNAVDRDTKTCTANNPIGTTSPEQTVSWSVNLDAIYSIYSISILFKNYGTWEERQRGRFAGFHLYLSNSDVWDSDSPCYVDGPELPLLNFTTTCVGHGRYVIFYNERLKGVQYPAGYETSSVYTELCEVIVKGCQKQAVYGKNCDIPCPDNCQDSVCNIVDGTCFGCLPGWKGDLCENKCQQGWYGQDCKNQCAGHCIGNVPCNHVTGGCDNGCAAGWMSTKCDKQCIDGTYGPGCIHNCSGHCQNDVTCNKETGHCDNGCKPGYTGHFCKEVCSPGSFGDQCKERCSGHCLNDKDCHFVDGICTDGCDDGYIGKYCNKTCNRGYFGANCSSLCAEKCNDPCRHTDGFCNCSFGYKGPNCNITCVGSYGINCRHKCSEHCVNNTCDKVNGSCAGDCSGSFHGEKCDQGIDSDFLSVDALSSETLTVGIVVGGCSVVIFLAVMTAMFLRLKRRKSARSEVRKTIIQNRDCPPMELKVKDPLPKPTNNQRNENVNDMKLPVNDVIETVKRGRPTNKTIPVKNLRAIIDKMSLGEHAGFKHEYHEIPRGELHQCEEAKKPENKAKNRYTTTFPYDHSRVVLKTSSTGDGGYINASYIEDAEGKRAYIATQGPKPKTIADFWRMIWQDSVYIIVCLTNLKEGTKNKCALYWPGINDKIHNGDLTIRNLGEKEYANWTIRQFKFYNSKEQNEREVVMFHYTQWPDHGVPDPLSLVVFHRQVLKTSSSYSGRCTVVHCSAGIGRTGTYIALDALYRVGDWKGKINVPMYVRTMRKDRMNMIQGDEQYKTVYLALLESFRGKSRCLTTEHFVRESGGESCYANAGDVTSKSPKRSDFEELLSLRKEYSQKDYESGRANITANYTASVLPVERFMCRLSYTKGRTTYYNAVLHQTFTANDLLISAQYPLPDYTEDFLRLVKDFDIRVVVFMCPLKDLKSSPIWLPSKTETKTVGNLTVKLTTLTNSENVSTTKIILAPREGSEMQVTVLECKTWKDGEPVVNKRPLLDVIKETKSENTKQERRILILSSDGAARCGPFCVVYNAMEQIAMDTEVDIFTITRQLQVRRPEFLSNLDEYQLCHDVVAEYLQNDSVYANS